MSFSGSDGDSGSAVAQAPVDQLDPLLAAIGVGSLGVEKSEPVGFRGSSGPRVGCRQAGGHALLYQLLRLVDQGCDHVVLADHNKWGVVSLASFATLDEVNVLVTDSLLSADAQAILTTQVGEILV